MNIHALPEDQPAQKSKEKTFVVMFKSKDTTDGGLLKIPGFGLRVDSDMVEILGVADIIAAFPKTEIIGVWPENQPTT